jgi:hypothetical protein
MGRQGGVGAGFLLKRMAVSLRCRREHVPRLTCTSPLGGVGSFSFTSEAVLVRDASRRRSVVTDTAGCRWVSWFEPPAGGTSDWRRGSR